MLLQCMFGVMILKAVWAGPGHVRRIDCEFSGIAVATDSELVVTDAGCVGLGKSFRPWTGQELGTDLWRKSVVVVP